MSKEYNSGSIKILSSLEHIKERRIIPYKGTGR